MKIYSSIQRLALSKAMQVVALLLAFASSSIHAETGEAVVSGGGVVKFTNATTNWVNGELVLVFSNSTEASSFELPGTTSARILAVGGGGGGGGVYNLSTSGGFDGGAGGGGAGGMLEVTNLYSAATYVVNVGTGGIAGAVVTSRSKVTAGGDGGDTTITTNGVAMLTAVGGGGGGGECEGRPGGSGGGGSMLRVDSSNGTPMSGGDGKSGQGNAGGLGGVGNYGGGGGGAGEAGSDGSATSPYGKGGDGRQSDITGESLYYAGGGGGGNSDKNATSTVGIAGGQGGGGLGGVGNKKFAATSGDPGTGGGGGGASYNVIGGNGGSGVVYIRISSAMEGEFEKPATFVSTNFDGKVHYSVKSTVFYDVTGDNSGTNVGEYKAHVRLKDGVSWPDGTKDELDVTLKINPCEVTFSDLHLELEGVRTNGWTFGDAETPEPECTVTPAWVLPVYEYHSVQAVGTPLPPEEGWTTLVPTEAGSYVVRVRADNDYNYAFEAKFFAFTIAKKPIVFSGLYQSDWMYGTPDYAIPRPICTVTPPVFEPIYEYADTKEAPEADWSEKPPSEPGIHWVRVRAPTADDYTFEIAYADFRIVGGLGGIYSDYVEITVTNTTGEALVNFPYKLTLSEEDPHGFLYSRTGPTGEKIAFTDDSGDNMLPFAVDKWVTNGVSTVYVQLPELAVDAGLKIRLYWCVRAGAKAPAYNPNLVWSDWSKAAADAKLPDPLKFITTPVSRDGLLVNYWVSPAKLSNTLWDTGDPEEKWGKILSDAKLAFGPTEKTITNLVTGATYETMPTNAFGGSFRVSYVQKDSPEWPLVDFEPLEWHIDFSITTPMPLDDLKGDARTLTLSGRVMLANDDWFGAATPTDSHAVTDQSYWQTREVDIGGGVKITNDVYWVHGGENHGQFQYDILNLFKGTQHWLNYTDGKDEKTLWRLSDVMIGNLYATDDGLYTYINALPHSATGRGISTYSKRDVLTSEKKNFDEVGALVLRNKDGAAIYSPCYTNGIGTIYFDVVNGVIDDAGADFYRIVVEVATGTEEIDPKTGEPKIPTDENAREPGAATIEEELGRITEWVPYTMLPLRRSNAGQPFEPLAETNDFALAISAGQSAERFYRMCVKVDCRKPVRFRIRRPLHNGKRSADNGSLILVDNIVVSYPPMGAEMAPNGTFDTTRGLGRTLGVENAMMTPFPSVTDEAIYARGVPDIYVNGSTNANPTGFIARSRLHYRWTYLDQASNDWDVVDLNPGEDFVALTALTNVPSHECDVEWWYENFVNVPYYDYYDYSGRELFLKGAGGQELYSEKQSVVTNANPNWFFRLRAGQSDVEDFVLIVKTSASGAEREIPMSVVADGTWRGFYQTTSAVDGGDGKGLFVRFEARNRQTPGSLGFSRNVTCYVLTEDVSSLEKPASYRVAEPDEWARVVCDATTGYLLFQLLEPTQGAMVVHADYQNFDKWNDANKTNAVTHLFVGTSTATSGVSSVARQLDENFGWWHASVATNDFWQEYFKVDEADMRPGGDFPVYEPFSENYSPNGLSVGPGQWVTANYRDVKTGMAYQMEGRGKGYLQFVDAAESPRGVESISFRPRLAQFIEFGDFTYFDGDKISLTNYTFYCRGAYDVNERRDFAGNASLSLVAFYKSGAGCYELRVEQYNANIVHAADGDQVSAGEQQLISLYRWNYDDETGEVLATLLGSTVVANSAMLTTSGEKGSYGLLFISAENTGTQSKICAGVSTGVATIDSTTKASCQWVSFIDTSDQRLKNGTYGVLSANCPGRFRYLYYSKKAQAPTTTTANTFHTKSQDFNFPGTEDRTSCREAIDKGGWAIQQRRARPLDIDDGSTFGFAAATVSNQVNVYTAPAGSTAFKTLLTNVWITSFGSAEKVTIPLWQLDECSVKIAAGGTAKSARNDIVIDDVVLRQWRGENFDDKEGLSYFKETGYGSPSNFVFTQAWILSNETTQAVSVELNARRSYATVATSVRSPLFDGNDGRGLGLGMFSFAYTNAQPNARLLLQICTNDVDIGSLSTVSKSVSESYWKTVATYDFATMGEKERRSGSFTHYLGLHEVKGVMRLAVDPTLVSAVAGSTDPSAFGSVEITAVACRDEPGLDEYAWWGWNLQTTDAAGKQYLGDVARGGLSPATGMSFGLNNSVSAATGDLWDDPELYLAHLPFLQTPTFGTETVGEVTFKARRYSPADPSCRVTLYGAKRESLEDDTKWKALRYWTISNDLYETFSYKTAPGEGYCAFRFAVTGVPDVDVRMPAPTPQEEPPLADPVRRVLIDEVVVMEAIRARVAFRNVGAFRSDLQGDEVVPNVPSRAEQPLCRESWGVQCEIFVPQLPDEVDLSTAQVKLWWYEGVEPWGFENWKDSSRAKSAYLAPCADSNLVFRSSYETAGDAIVPPLNNAGTVQYMLEVSYKTKKGETTVNYLTSADWQTPEWYNPIDYNRQYGRADGSFSAYTILDTVAAGWAWINEANLFGDYVNWQNSDAPLQFIEIAAPNDADLTDWTIRFLDAQWGAHRVVTNEVARFGYSLPGLKKGLKGLDAESKCVFHVLGSPLSKGVLKESEGQVDGYWSFQDVQSASDQLSNTGEVASYHPLSIQLVRPSGIIEHEITCVGTNYYLLTDESCDPAKHVDYLNAQERAAGGQGQFFYAGADEGGREPGASEYTWSRSLGVQAGNGRFPAVLAADPTNYWNNVRTMTPGEINEGQKIEGAYPQPLGTMIAIYSAIGSAHLRQTFGDAEGTVETVKIFFPKGEEGKAGTNITYEVDNWYELAPVTQTVNGVRYEMPAVGPVARRYTVNVAANVSNDVTVTAEAVIAKDLREKYKLGPDNKYTAAVMHWLEGGSTLQGAFHRDDGFIGLADFQSWSGSVTNQLSLTEMFWLDMDPTWNDHDLVLRAGWSKPPTPVTDPAKSGNVQVAVKMMITNTSDEATAPLAWAPYVLRSADPGVTSWDFADAAWAWSNATFKVTGMLINSSDLSGLKDRSNWLPLRWFVFGGGKSGGSVYSTSFDGNFESEIELIDPFSKASPGYNAGWSDYRGIYPVWNMFDLDDRLRPTQVEVLKAKNPY